MKCRVVGVSFAPNYPEAVQRLYDTWCEWQLRGEHIEPLPAILKRNPANPHDANAVEVHVPSMGQMIGHLQAGAARLMAPKLDKGELWQAEITEVRINPEYWDRPGIDVELHRVPEGAAVRT